MASATTPNPLNGKADFFDVAQYASAPLSLQSAVEALEQAHQAAYGIQSLATLLYADTIERNDTDHGQPLDGFLRGGLEMGLLCLARCLNEDLSDKSGRLARTYSNEQATAKKGGK